MLRVGGCATRLLRLCGVEISKTIVQHDNWVPFLHDLKHKTRYFISTIYRKLVNNAFQFTKITSMH